MTKFAKRLTTISNFWKNIYVKCQQHACYNKLKEEPGENEVLSHVDYSENYSNIQQGEMQRAYFGHNSFLIFTTCSYLRKDGDHINENISIIPGSAYFSHFLCVQYLHTMPFLKNLGFNLS